MLAGRGEEGGEWSVRALKSLPWLRVQAQQQKVLKFVVCAMLLLWKRYYVPEWLQ